MRLLLDTQIVQWLALTPGKLRRDERHLIDGPRHHIVISAVSLWEMRTKWQTSYRSGQRKGEADPQRVIATLDKTGFAYERLAMTFAHCTAVLDVAFDHNDQVDRLLLAQAQVEGLRLLTRDHKFEGHPLALIA